jgi:hypothetical protein
MTRPAGLTSCRLLPPHQRPLNDRCCTLREIQPVRKGTEAVMLSEGACPARRAFFRSPYMRSLGDLTRL